MRSVVPLVSQFDVQRVLFGVEARELRGLTLEIDQHGEAVPVCLFVSLGRIERHVPQSPAVQRGVALFAPAGTRPWPGVG